MSAERDFIIYTDYFKGQIESLKSRLDNLEKEMRLQRTFWQRVRIRIAYWLLGRSE